MDRSNRFRKYEDLIDQIDQMIADKGRGFNVAREMNDAMWDDLEARKRDLTTSVEHMKSIQDDDQLADELTNADSIYEATRSYINKVSGTKRHI